MGGGVEARERDDDYYGDVVPQCVDRSKIENTAGKRNCEQERERVRERERGREREREFRIFHLDIQVDIIIIIIIIIC